MLCELIVCIENLGIRISELSTGKARLAGIDKSKSLILSILNVLRSVFIVIVR